MKDNTKDKKCEKIINYMNKKFSSEFHYNWDFTTHTIYKLGEKDYMNLIRYIKRVLK